MQIGECRLVLNQCGSCVPKRVTPAEYRVLIEIHKTNAGRHPIKDLKVVGEEARNDKDERDRLEEAYDRPNDPNKQPVKKLYPGDNPKLPQKFEDVTPKGGELSPLEAKDKEIAELKAKLNPPAAKK